MPSGYEVAGGIDFDSVLAPLHAGWAPAAGTGYGIGGIDLNARYAPITTGSAPAATGYKKAGADLNTIFAAFGSTGVQVGTQPSNVSGSAAAGNPSGVVSSGSTTCAGIKGKGTYTYAWTTSGCTALSPSSATTTFNATVNAGTTENATAFCTISDGTTSVNTTTIAVTLQNTTSAFSPTLILFSSAGSFVATVPSGATSVEIEAFGSTAWGGQATPGIAPTNGGGGGSGALSRSRYAVSGGQTIDLIVGATGTGPTFPATGGASQVSSGSLTVTTMIAGPGGAGGLNNANGAGGAASGGNLANIAGSAATSRLGAPGIVGDHATGNRGGSGGIGDRFGTPEEGQTTGGPGLIALYYT